ncbi:MAG: carboxymuconolactone decarboxylase family protein [Flammeovirgaceae bacterium]
MTTTIQNETALSLLQELGLSSEYHHSSLEKLAEIDAKYLKDLKMNLKSVLKSEKINEKEASLLAVAIATNNKELHLQEVFAQMAQKNGASKEEVAEAIACASLLSANNVFYRFRHFIKKEKYHQLPAKMRMSLMMNPLLGKEFFELMSLAVSAVNGCEMCVNAHEKSLLELGSTEERIFEAVRLAAVITSLGKIV